MDRPEVAKVIVPRLLGSEHAVSRFLREVRAAGRLDHPNTVRGYAADTADGRIVLLMEYVDGADLGKRLADAEGGRLPVATACEYARQAAVGLAHAHERGLIHRDVKPSNLMVRAGGDGERVVVLDFGLVRSEDDPNLTGRGAAMGTPFYMPPEQWRDAAAADARSDVYALGATLFHLIAGRPPFEGGPHAVMLAHVQERPARLDAVRPGVPAALADLVERMLAKDPACRPQTMAEVAAALAPFADPDAAVTYTPPPPRRWAATAAVAAGLLAAVAVGLAAWPRGGSPVGPTPPTVPTTPPPPPEPRPPQVARPGNGMWRVDAKAGELIQEEKLRRPAVLRFGQPTWGDYEIAVEARRESGFGWMLLTARANSADGESVRFQLGSAGGQEFRLLTGPLAMPTAVAVREPDSGKVKGGLPTPPVKEWFTVKLRVTGRTAECLYGHGAAAVRVFREEVPAASPTGGVALTTHLSEFRFRNLKVTAADGRVLWDGLPEAIEKPAD
jgi:hypothetical protein